MEVRVIVSINIENKSYYSTVYLESCLLISTFPSVFKGSNSAEPSFEYLHFKQLTIDQDPSARMAYE